MLPLDSAPRYMQYLAHPFGNDCTMVRCARLYCSEHPLNSYIILFCNAGLTVRRHPLTSYFLHFLKPLACLLFYIVTATWTYPRDVIVLSCSFMLAFLDPDVATWTCLMYVTPLSDRLAYTPAHCLEG
jgi:hypothetical protein